MKCFISNNTKRYCSATYLPHRVGVLARLGGALINRLISVFLQVIHCDVTIIEPHRHQVRQLFVDVQTHDPSFSVEYILRVGGVLQGEEEQHASSLLHQLDLEEKDNRTIQNPFGWNTSVENVCEGELT